jgi:hypothetical protein
MAMIERRRLRRALSVLFAALMLSLSLAPLAATLGREEDHQCNCGCPKGKCKCCKRSPASAGDPTITSGYPCAGQCGCAVFLRISSKLFYPLAVARDWAVLLDAGAPAAQPLLWLAARTPDPLHQRPPPSLF